MNLSAQILSDLTVFQKYAKYLKDETRRETFKEISNRNKDMHIKKYPFLKDEIDNIFDNFVSEHKVLPSMRAMQFAGKPIELNPTRIYNCCFLPVDHPLAFSEIMFLLLGGTGVGYSVQQHHIRALPEIRKPTKSRRYLVGDSIEGWADAVKMLISAYFMGKPLPRFDFSDIREKGAPLITSGGKAPGAEPLKDCLHHLQKILDRKENGSQLTSLEVHDMICYIADAVLAGGIRRAACISLFSMSDNEMLTCKYGNWAETNPQRARANNSVVILRHKVKKKDFLELWKKIKASGSGEPGIVFSNNAEWGVNPCCEISLRPFQFCNLVEINLSDITSQEDLNERAKAAAFIGTLQASYTDFHYLRDIWKKTTEKEALIGVSGTGIASGEVFKYDLKLTAQAVVEENARVAKLLGINPSARSTCVKPSGTTSLVLGTSSGIHAWFAKNYLRRLRVGKNEAIYKYFVKHLPDFVEDDYFKPHSDAVISIPMEAPRGAITSDEESPIDLLNRIKYFHDNWIKPGHTTGDNSHNVSATIYVKEDEWETVGDWMWVNRDCYNGLSVFPYDGGAYIQAPHEAITKTKYNKMLELLKAIDLTKVKEVTDDTSVATEVACAGGVCEWTGAK